MDLKEAVLGRIKHSKDGVLQSELWKELDIDSRKCSRIVIKLEEEEIIEREWETHNGNRTYRIRMKGSANGSEAYELLMAGEMISPCVGCEQECDPAYCDTLGEWVYRLYGIDA